MAVSTLPTSQYWSVHQSHGCQYTAHLTILVSASITCLSVHCPLHNTGQCISHMAVSTLPTSQYWSQHQSHGCVSTLPTSHYWSQHQSHGCVSTLPTSQSWSVHQPHSCVGTLPTSQYWSGLRVKGVTVRKTSMGRMPPSLKWHRCCLMLR